MRAKLAQLSRRLTEIDAALSQEDAARDMDQFRRLSRERAEIEPLVAGFQQYLAATQDLATAQQMLADPEVRALAEEDEAADAAGQG